ncbi:hypothetical protein [uncultured Croceitalea sp.]|uniref:hypothetical protein n=1 Tax=uncultured Croceitalea sp. TaxID=1798908 RepID=UPI0033057DDD
MVDKLLLDAFEKVGKDTGNETDNGRASHLEQIIIEEYKTPITARSLIRYLKKENNPKLDIRNALAQYLGFNNYEDYVSQNSDSFGKPQGKLKIKSRKGIKTKFLWGVFGTLIAGNLAYIGFTSEEECMLWVENHYEKCECTGQALEFALNETELEKFRKVDVCDKTTFFKEYDPVIWYDKYNGKIEFFTYYGRNPMNGRTLKPITQTIIDGHVKPCYSIE